MHYALLCRKTFVLKFVPTFNLLYLKAFHKVIFTDMSPRLKQVSVVLKTLECAIKQQACNITGIFTVVYMHLLHEFDLTAEKQSLPCIM